MFTFLLAFEWITTRGPDTTQNRAGNPNRAWRFGCGLVLVTTMLLIWINGAVGIIGDHNPANLMYGAVPITLILGAALARLRPPGMTRALLVTALVQALIPLIALVLWSPGTIAWAPSVFGIFALNTLFVALWLAAAWLFRKAAQEN